MDGPLGEHNIRLQYLTNLQRFLTRIPNGAYVLGGSANDASKWTYAQSGLNQLGITTAAAYKVSSRQSFAFVARKGYMKELKFVKKYKGKGPARIVTTLSNPTGNNIIPRV